MTKMDSVPHPMENCRLSPICLYWLYGLVAPCKRLPESSKFLLLESGIQRTGIWNPQWFGIRNPLWYGIEIYYGVRNPESWNPESRGWDPESRTFMDSLSWGETRFSRDARKTTQNINEQIMRNLSFLQNLGDCQQLDRSVKHLNYDSPPEVSLRVLNKSCARLSCGRCRQSPSLRIWKLFFSKCLKN